MWIYNHPDWPNFTWNAQRLASKLAKVRHQQGRLLGSMEGLGFDLKRKVSLSTLTQDAVKSSAIEGEHLDWEDVRSSVARRLGIKVAGLTKSSQAAESQVAITLDATQQFSKKLTKTRLCKWHAALFPAGYSGIQCIAVGKYRTPPTDPMQVVSGPIGKYKVHFEAPKAKTVAKEMQAFLKWFQKNTPDPLVRAGIAHLWFVTIHPFEDGNGRIARAISDMALAQADNSAHRFYSLSAQIEAERKNYYHQLEQQQLSSPDLTPWLEWFVHCLESALNKAEQSLEKTLFKARLWNQINQNPVNKRQRLIINLMLEDHFKGHMNTAKYAKLAKCSKDTALRDIQNLKARHILIQNPGRGRSTSYKIASAE